MHRKIDEGGGAHRNQHVGAQPRGPLPVLPLRPDQGAKYECRGQADQGVEKVVDLEGG
jgi:hypothetical protein